MSPLIQTCIVLIALSAVTMAVVTVVVGMRLVRLTRELRQPVEKAVQVLQQSASEVQAVTRRVDSMVASVGQAVPSIHHAVHQFEQVSERASRLSNAVLEEIEAPVRNAVAVARGVRVGTSALLDALARRAHLGSYRNGGTP
jgi:methyl-accepting chemotaxis protein